MGKVRQIFIWNGKQDLGPFRREELIEHIRTGVVLPRDYYCEEGMTEWQRVSTLPCCNRFLATDAQKQMLSRMGVNFYEFLTKDDVSSILESQPATNRQIALLQYLGIIAPIDLTKANASEIIDKARNDPALADRFDRWNIERLDAYPHLYADERSVYKAGRATCLLAQYNEFRRDVRQFPHLSVTDIQQMITRLDSRTPGWDHDLLGTGLDYVIAEIEKTGRI